MDERKRVLPPSRDDRGSPRVPCDIPVKIVTPSSWPPARVLDLSRSGIRLGVAVHDERSREEFGLDRLAGMMRKHLSVNLIIDLWPSLGRERVRRGLKVVRIGPHREEEGCLEIGCELLPPLDEAEAQAFGLRKADPEEVLDEERLRRAMRGRERSDWDSRRAPGLRRVDRRRRDPQEDWEEASRVPRPGAGTRAGEGMTALVDSRRRHHAPALEGRPLEFSAHGGYVWLDLAEGQELFPEDANLADRVVAFSRTYGGVVDLKIRRDDVEVWCGAVRVVSVGVMPEVPGRLILGFTYRRPLDAWEAEALTAVDPSPASTPPAGT